MQNNFKLLTGRENKDLVQHQGYLINKAILNSFIQLQNKAKKEINADLQIISSFRDYNRQEIIWNNKAEGQRPVYDDFNKRLNKNEFSQKEFVEKIMRFSALPGASRHHWGTDLDVFDANKIVKDQVQLTHNECVQDGPCAPLHSWLDDQIASEHSFNFFRPYEDDLGGVSTEKWHLSYAPLAMELYNQYTIETFIKNIEIGEIASKEIILENPQFFFEKYVNNIKFP